MRIVILGAPGSGKGTQAAFIKETYQIAHISTGDLLRAAVRNGTPLGLKAKSVMEAGQLVSDELVLGMLAERLAADDTRNGFILDGYPRNLVQVAALDELLTSVGQPLDIAVKLTVPFDIIVGRCEIRFKAEGRKDDNPEVVRERLRIYSEQTEPVVAAYRAAGRLVEIDGVGQVAEITTRIQDTLKPYA